jgi:hypothetical protein
VFAGGLAVQACVANNFLYTRVHAARKVEMVMCVKVRAAG